MSTILFTGVKKCGHHSCPPVAVKGDIHPERESICQEAVKDLVGSAVVVAKSGSFPEKEKGLAENRELPGWIFRRPAKLHEP